MEYEATHYMVHLAIQHASVAKKHQHTRILFCQKNYFPLTNAFQKHHKKSSVFLLHKIRSTMTASRALDKNYWLLLVSF